MFLKKNKVAEVEDAPILDAAEEEVIEEAARDIVPTQDEKVKKLDRDNLRAKRK